VVLSCLADFLVKNIAPSRILTESDNLSELEEHIGGLSTDVKKKGNGKIGIGISFSLVVMLCLFLRGHSILRFLDLPALYLGTALARCNCYFFLTSASSLSGYNVGWSTAGVALMAMALEGIATQTSPSWVFNEVHPLTTGSTSEMNSMLYRELITL